MQESPKGQAKEKALYIVNLDMTRIFWIVSISILLFVFLFLLGYWAGSTNDVKHVLIEQSNERLSSNYLSDQLPIQSRVPIQENLTEPSGNNPTISVVDNPASDNGNDSLATSSDRLNENSSASTRLTPEYLSNTPYSDGNNETDIGNSEAKSGSLNVTEPIRNDSNSKSVEKSDPSSVVETRYPVDKVDINSLPIVKEKVVVKAKTKTDPKVKTPAVKEVKVTQPKEEPLSVETILKSGNSDIETILGTTSQKGNYNIQIAVYSNKSYADNGLSKLKELGFGNSYLGTRQGNAGTLYVLNVGPFTDQASSQSALTRLHQTPIGKEAILVQR